MHTTTTPGTEATLTAEAGDSETTLHAGLAKLRSRDDDARGLFLVGVYKMVKVAFFSFLGFGALHLIHKNIGDEVLRLTEMLRLGPESHVVSFLMDKADLIGHHQLREASIFAFGYAGLCLIEGTGLLLRRVWAEYFTVILTLMGLPLESYELLQRFNWFKVGALVVNLVVLLYLVTVLKRKRARDAQA
jgi:uncharacterized membrane protein (DUF2068 family)